MLSVEDAIVGEEWSLSGYVSSSPKPLLKLLEECFPPSSGLFGADYRESVKTYHLELYLSKPIHGQFMCEINTQCVNGYGYIRQGKLNKETERFIMAAQEQALAANLVKNRIHYLPVSPLCRLCHSCDETVDHLTSSC